ncbi:MAG: carboxymuconolactone decarboxylase family protein, partial [Myxococcota bacterium]
LQAGLSDEEILELTYVVGLYFMHAVMTRALKLEYDEVPERIVEVPAPTGDQRTSDFMGGVGRE